MSRKTIKDIAHEAGVSITAVSFALNNRPGISEQTRERILDIANKMDWVPNSRAQSLSLAKADAVGLFIARQPDSYTSERFFFNFIVGLQETLTHHNYDLVFHTGPDLEAEIATYRTWWAQGRVDGVVVVDPIDGDPRIDILNEIGLPAVVVGNDVPNTASIIGDEAAIVTTLADHLYDQGARTIGYVTGIPSLIHTQERIRALENYARERGLTALVASGANATEEAGRNAIAELLDAHATPDAIIFDNEILTLGGFNALRAAGKEIGRDVLICSCEDSPLCRIVTPSITVINREPAAIGRQAAALLLDVLNGKKPRLEKQEPADIIIRDSTGKLPQKDEEVYK
ncbi:LacI family DNA-binding transcriptional regulator [Arcanobacterium phocae]|uniref:DNA-binding transcriptional regulator, LacI/PurR family n=1 Tax=Arcanobacterium phocae TaxID=131112 RepID=A0A1H2LBX7_9ACTO|nr:LacI family DNA-binding transcriptional regulator [Arcanobacterium phocae]SDU78314.1 DNA-binding transcriptional regulator, LacI/PurR family [Arcanobacterium phocae]